MVSFTILILALIAFVFISCVEAVDGNAGASAGCFFVLILLAIFLWTMLRTAQGQGDAPAAGSEAQNLIYSLRITNPRRRK